LLSFIANYRRYTFQDLLYSSVAGQLGDNILEIINALSTAY